MKIDGLILTDLRQMRDARGGVFHMLRASDPHFIRFGEVYFSMVGPGQVKAWKRHRRMTLNLAVPVGEILLIVYDDRPDSPTRGTVVQITLGEEPSAYRLATVPPMLWFGFANPGGQPALLANCATLEHDPDEVDRLPQDDDSIPYQWTIR